MSGQVGILNVGAGDTKLSFDKSNPAEAIRAARIVKDMIRHGYALLVEVERDGVKAYERALDFREDTQEYIIADFDPQPETRRAESETSGEEIETSEQTEQTEKDAALPIRRGRGRGRKAIPACDSNAIAVSRSAGG